MEPVLGNGLPAKAASGVVLAAADSVDSFCICDAIQGPRGLGGGAGHIMAEEERGLRVEQVPQGPLGLLCLLDVPQHLCEESHGRLGVRYCIGATRSCSRDEQVVGESGGEGPQGHPDGGVCSLCLADGESLRKINYRSEILASLYPEPGTVIRGSLDGSSSRMQKQLYLCGWLIRLSKPASTVTNTLNSKVRQLHAPGQHPLMLDCKTKKPRQWQQQMMTVKENNLSSRVDLGHQAPSLRPQSADQPSDSTQSFLTAFLHRKKGYI